MWPFEDTFSTCHSSNGQPADNQKEHDKKQVIFQRASGTILSHDTRGQSFAKPPERTDITDESRPENADNEQQQERVSQRRGFISYKVVMRLNIMTKFVLPNILGQRPQKTNLCSEMEYWTRKKGENVHHPQSRLPEITERIKKFTVTVAYYQPIFSWMTEFKQTPQRGARLHAQERQETPAGIHCFKKSTYCFIQVTS